MDKISSKTTEVASLSMYLPLNLQLFAEEEGYPNLEDSSEFKEDAKEFNSKMDKYVEERESKKPAETVVEKEPVKESEKAATPEVAVPEEKPKQDTETNKAFQEMRKQLEAQEAKAKKADELIAAQFGKQGITTVEQYEQWIKQGEIEEENERYKEAGLTEKEIEKLRRADVTDAELTEIKETKAREAYLSQWDSLYKVYPEIQETSKAFAEGKDPEWYNDEMKAEIARGASPLAAYRNAHFETILANATKGTKEVAKQEALNTLNSKNHMKPSGSEGGDVDHVEIDPEQMKMFRALNKGKSDADIRKWYKQNVGK